ncbi:MAG TPA: hypothetical protein VGQ83_43630 [Polyangia bacterium]
MRAALVATLALACGCFDPQFQPGFKCGDPNLGPACPDGFFCAADLTCQRNGTEEIPGEVFVGSAYERPALAPLDDGAVLVARRYDPDTGREWYELQRLSPKGALSDAQELTTFDDEGTDPDSLVGAGNQENAVVAGTSTSGVQVVRAGKSAVSLDHYPGLRLPAVFASTAYACVAAFNGGLSRQIAVVCTSGGPLSTTFFELGVGRPLAGLAGAVSDQTNDPVLVWETDTDVTGKASLFVKCSNALVRDGALATVTPPAGDRLRPQVFWSEADNVLAVAYQSFEGYNLIQLNADCTVSGQGTVGETGTYGYAVTGRAPTGGVTEPELWRLFLYDDVGTPVAGYGRLLPGSMITVVEGAPGGLANPAGVTDGKNQPLLLYWAANPDAGDGTGVVRGCDAMGGWGGTPLDLSRAGALPRYAVAPRKAGGLFLAYSVPVGETTPHLKVRVFDEHGDPVVP